MNDSVSRLKELLFDAESATLTELRTSIDLVAEAERRGHADLAARLQRLDEAQKRAEDELRRTNEERQRIATALATRIEPLERNAGSREAMLASVAEVLDESLVAAREQRHDQMTRAVAPLVVRTIKTELRNSRDELVEALYPITGRMVKAYVASAMKDLMNQINRRLETNRPTLFLRSLLSGYSMADLAVAATQRLEVEELYLIRRGSGSLIQRWPESPGRSNSDIHLSSVITAINDFAGHAFEQDGGNLRSFNLDDFTVFLRASPVYLLASKCRGIPVRGVEGLIDAEFVDIVRRQHDLEIDAQAATSGSDIVPVGEGAGAARSWQDAGAARSSQVAPEIVPSGLLSDLHDRLTAGIEDRHAQLARAGLPFSPFKALATLLALALLAGGGFLAYATYEEQVARGKAHEIVENIAALKGFPIEIDVGWRGRRVAATGFAPSPTARSDLEQRLKAALPETAVSVDRMAVLSTGPDLSPELAEVRRSITGLGAEVKRDIGGLGIEVATNGVRRSLDRAIGRLEQTHSDLVRLLALTDATKRAVASRTDSEIGDVLRDLKVHRASLVDLARQSPAGSPDAADRTAPPPNAPDPRTVLAQASARLQTISDELSTLVGAQPGGGRPTPASALNAPSAGTDTAVEDLSLAAERVATIATAAVQASSIRIPAPVINSPGPTPRERLVAFTRSTAIFFGDSDVYRSPDRANAALDELAHLLTATTALLRVVGYTDERGGTGRNVSLSQTRAEKVSQALVARGVPRERLVVLGRANGLDLSSVIGSQSPNRRVEFEVGFDDESAAGP